MILRRVVVVAIATIAAFVTPPASRAASLSAAESDSVTAAIQAKMAERHIPGLQVAVVRNNEIVFLKSFGVADLKTKKPVTNETLFRIASTTKPVSATAAMQLYEKGALDLDAPVQKYAPTFPVKKYEITPRQLLSHTSGVRNYRRGEPERTDHFDHLTDALSIFAGDSLDFEPGTKYSYTSFGYTLLGVVIEGASKTSFWDYLDKNVVRPSGMTHTRPDSPQAARSQGYTPNTYAVFDGDYGITRPMDSSYKLPAGGLLSTAEDMAHFAIAFMKGSLVNAETMKTMMTEQTTRDGTPTGYALGWYAGSKRQPAGSVWHGGVQPGFTSDFWLIPQEKFAVVILGNLEGGGILGLEKLADKIGQYARTPPR